MQKKKKIIYYYCKLSINNYLNISVFNVISIKAMLIDMNTLTNSFSIKF